MENKSWPWLDASVFRKLDRFLFVSCWLLKMNLIGKKNQKSGVEKQLPRGKLKRNCLCLRVTSALNTLTGKYKHFTWYFDVTPPTYSVCRDGKNPSLGKPTLTTETWTGELLVLHGLTLFFAADSHGGVFLDLVRFYRNNREFLRATYG